MGKRYDWQVTPQNTPHFKERRILFLTAIGIWVLNLIFAGVFLVENVTWFLVGAFVLVSFAVVQCFDIRREMWTWSYVFFWVIFSFVASAILILWHKAYCWFVGYGIELLVFVLLTVRLLKKRTAKTHKK